MNLRLPVESGKAYSSRSQQIRVISENWVNNTIFCPNCGHNLTNFANNRPVADFYCNECREEFELKSKKGSVGKKIVNGAYFTMISRLISNNNPNLFFLSYDLTNLEIINFLAIPKYFFVPDIIEKRKPLNLTARRAGWIGCNIIVANIPEFGKIFYVQDGVVVNKDAVINKWKRTEFVKSTHDIEAKGWMLDVLLCVEKMREREFSLRDIYRYESFLKIKHPDNNNIKAKIRQQLQYLRDRNVLKFLGAGRYKLL